MYKISKYTSKIHVKYLLKCDRLAKLEELNTYTCFIPITIAFVLSHKTGIQGLVINNYTSSYKKITQTITEKYRCCNSNIKKQRMVPRRYIRSQLLTCFHLNSFPRQCHQTPVPRMKKQTSQISAVKSEMEHLKTHITSFCCLSRFRYVDCFLRSSTERF